MKKFNLIKKLLAMMLILVASINTVWAEDYYLDISNFTSWTPEQDGSYSLWDGSNNIHSTYVSTNLYKFTTSKTPTTLYFKRKDSGSNEFSVTRSSTYNVYKVTGWNAGSCANYNISTVSKTNYIYFNNATTGWTNTYKYFVIGHDKPSAYSKVYALSSISNTKLLYVKQDADNWSDVSYYGFNASNSSYSNGSWGTSSFDDAAKRTAPYTGKYNMNSGSSYYCEPSSASNDQPFTITYKSGYSSIPTFNAIQSAKKRETGTTYTEVSGSYPATLKLKGTKLDGNGSSTRGTIERSASTDGSSYSTYSAVVTGLITHSLKDGTLSSDYYLEGWGTGSTPSKTDATYDYNITAATTVFAFFSHLYTLDFDRKGTYGTSTVSASVADYTSISSGDKVPTGHTITVTASPATGYEVEGWYSDASCSSAYTSGLGGVTISADKNTFTLASLNANSGVYCKFRRKTTTVTLNLHGADAGDESVTATFDEVLPSFTLATKDGGYSLTGYWTAASDGIKIINADGTLVRNTSYATDAATPLWKHTGSSLTLHAQWNNFLSVTYDGNENTGGSAPTDATEYASGDEVTVASAPVGMVKTGYSFAGWNTAPGGGGTSYAAGATFNISANTTLYAQWTENKRNVTISVSPSGAGTLNKTSASVGVATTTTVTATAQPGYRFTGWTATDCSVASTSSASTTLSGNGTAGSGTLVANFARTYAYIEGRMTVYNAARTSETHTASSKGGWDESSTRIEMEYDETNHRFYRHTYKTPAELKAQISSQDQWFSVKTGTVHNSFASGTVKAYHPSSNTNIATAGTKYSAPTTSTTYNFKFTNTATDGYAIIYFDEAGVWYELEQSLKYDANGGSGDAPTPTYYLRGTNATAASNPFTARKNYTFAGWNTAADITGTSYAAGASVPMSADRILYAKWNRSVTLDQQDATTPGSTSVTATWNCSTLPSITNPQKLDYEFGGWYTETAGNGNIIINTSGQLQANKTNWTVSGGKFQRTPSSDASESKPLYAKWTQTVTLNANTANHGSGDNTSATIVYKATAKTSITHCTPATGYHLEGYYTAATDGVKVLNADGSFASSAVTDYITDGKWTKAGATTLYAHYEPNTYDVILDVNGATTGSNQTVVATFDAAMPTIQKTSGDAITAPSKTGYTFGGYYANNTGTGTQYYTNALASNHIWDVATNNTHIYAKWTANPYTITLTQSGETGYGSAGTASVTATYDAALPTISSLPTAANGYAFMGYYTDHDGEGTQYYDATGTKLVASYTTADGLELFAYFKKAEVTEISFSPAAVVAPNTTITATPTISPTPTGTHIVCWEVQYSNGTALPSQPTFTPGASNSVSFSAPSASATYRLQATLRTGSSCSGGTELCVYSTTFQVAGEHTVTVRYQDESGRTLKDTIHITGKPLEWTTLGDITPPTITGYKFDHWDAGDGVTIKNGESTTTTTTTSSIQIKAVYDGTLTAVYNKKNMIFFNNTLGWSDVYVYFYSSDKYWVNDHIEGQGCGTGSDQSYEVGGSAAYYRGYHGHMTRIEGTNIWYYDYEAEHGAKDGGEIKGYDDVVFVETEQNNFKFFYNNKAARRGEFKHSLPMFVPINSVTETKNGTKYYSSGYWMNYPENTGYSLLIYNQKAKAGATKLYELPFEYTEDKTMPMELVMDLEAGQTYGFEIKRADGNYYSKDETVTANKTGLVVSTGQSTYCGLQTTAAGDYKFSLYYSNSNFKMDITYPVAVNDYRIVYTDLATWSKDAHTASWSHPSRVITKNSSATETKKDTVSFFWTYGSTPAIKYQTCTAVAAGSASWNAGTAIDVSGFSSVLTKKGVYNFIFEQPAGGASISLVKVEPYTGKYYIRTDCAGSSKWTNYRSTDHEMTYSEYTEKNHGYSHYFPHWVTTGQNVKFVIANDFSPCISDTLVEDKGTVVADITTEGNANAGRLNSGNASIRFMWNHATNKVSRAYISGSTNVSDRFLVLEGDAKMYDENGDALSISGLNANEINLVDDQNFVYERTIKVNTGARAKLTAKYNNNVQYFRGSEGAFADGTTVQLLGGEAEGKHAMRIVYDFKTNRLVTAYVPSGTIESDIAINADLMIVREHQDAGQQLLFNSGSLSEVKTVYGVMRFNRWTLNNKEKTGGHSPVGDPKSPYERALYWISFPFDVNLSDVFGFGTYGTHWIIMEYDGAERAKEGYWRDSEGFWKHVTNRTGKVLKAGKGYVLGLDLDLMKDDNTSFWAHNIEQVELFFPSAVEVEDISSTNVTTTVEEHECKIDRTGNNGSDINKNRTRADSHWNIIGIPSYANYGTTLEDGSGNTINWHTSPYTNDLPFLYEWSTVDNTYSVQSGTTYPFKSMHAYMVQYHGDLYWSMASATPVSPIVARRTYAEAPQNVEMRLELSQNEQKVDQTFVKLSNDENVSANFAFDEDLCKEYNANKANIYTIVENYLPVAGNTLPMSDQTTIVPVGVKIAATGDYTFAIPDGTSGVGVTLVDTETGIRTSLSALDYTVNLAAGTYDNRFLLEISPIVQTPTDVEEVTGDGLQVTGARKVIIDQKMYIIKDGKMYDAQGRQVK